MHGFSSPPYRSLLALAALATLASLGAAEARAGCGDYVHVGEVPAAVYAAHERRLLEAEAGGPTMRFAEPAGRPRPAPCRGPECGSRSAVPPVPASHTLSRSSDAGAAATLLPSRVWLCEARRVERREPRVRPVHVPTAPLRPPELREVFSR